MARRGDLSKRAEWRKRLRRQGESGLTVVECCEQEGISTASFYAWRRRLRATKRASKKARPAFEPVRLTPMSTPMSICLPGGVRVDLPMENLDAVRAVIGEVFSRVGGLDGADEPC